jgi:hypothetical protein
MSRHAGSQSGRGFATTFGAFAVVAVATVGFAVGDALATPVMSAATIAHRSERDESVTDWHWTLAPGHTLEIEGVNGTVRATGTAGREVVVHARKHARHSDPAQVTVEVLPHDGDLTLCVRYPDTFGHANTCAPGGHSHMSLHDNDVEVDFEVQVPAGVRFVGRTVNGTVEALGLAGDAELHTVNGAVRVETRGAAEAHTVNGSVHARVGRLGADRTLSFDTVNGSVEIELPDGAGADLRAHTLHGEIESDFPLEVTHMGRQWVGDRLEGTIGRGGARLELGTVNGSIRIHRGTSL